jgi:hypothetical protein
MDGLITGAGLRDGRLHLELRAEQDKPLFELDPGDALAFAVNSTRTCIGARPPGASSLAPCPYQATHLNASQCDQCFASALMLPCLRCTGERCNNPARRSDCVRPENHAVYLASFGLGILKVGVARWERRFERLAEQGARAALIIARDDGQQVRRLEAQLRRAGIRDRIPPQEKLRALTRVASVTELERELQQALETTKLRTIGRWIEPEGVSLPPAPLLKAQPRLLTPNKDFRLRGRIVAVIGQTLIIDSDTGEQVALEVTSLIGYQSRSLSEQEAGAGQLAMAF